MNEEFNKIEEGQIGENIIREYFKFKNIKHFQIDWMTYEDGDYRLNEVKHQEVFIPPPFYGHGLPMWQIKARIDFFTKARIIPYLYIVEKSDYEKKETNYLIWSQSLIALELGEYWDTKGEKPRRIYNIKNFNKIYFPKLV